MVGDGTSSYWNYYTCVIAALSRYLAFWSFV
jgi:hypothetical protein